MTSKEWRERNLERDREHKRRHARKWRLAVRENGKIRLVRLKYPKRPYPEQCELCGRQMKRLEYHHWMDDAPWVGLWLCHWCHNFVEAIENGLLGEQIKKYEMLKLKAMEYYNIPQTSLRFS